jgi:hypothetical protein
VLTGAIDPHRFAGWADQASAGIVVGGPAVDRFDF